MLLIFVQLKEILSMFLLCYHQLKSYFCKMVFLGFLLKWSQRLESNPQPMHYKCIALPLSYAGIFYFFFNKENKKKNSVR